MNKDILTGVTKKHLQQYQSGIWLHKEVVKPLQQLAEQAASAGFCLSIASGFRSFDRQLCIWNEKVKGIRPVLGASGKVIEPGMLDDEALMWAILRWSALPGTSRHHWGTDLDIWDAAAVDSNYCLQLEPHEYLNGGAFEPLMSWFEAHNQPSAGFFRPYSLDSGGVMPEPWHISFRPVATELQAQLSVEVVRDLLINTDISLKEIILGNLVEIFDRFVLGY